MPATVGHALSATTPDITTAEIRPSHWNQTHNVTLNLSATEISALFGNANGVSFGLNGGQITASVAAGGGGAVVSNAIQAVGSATGSGTNTSRFAADDHVHAGVFSMGASNVGNTAGDTRVGAGRFVLAGGANITLSQATAANGLNTISIVGAAGGGGGGSISAGTTHATLGQVVFSNAVDGVSFGVNGQTVTAAARALFSARAIGGTTSASSGTLPMSSWGFQGLGEMSVGVNTGGSVILVASPTQFSVPTAGNTVSSSSGVLARSSWGLQGAGEISVGVNTGGGFAVFSSPIDLSVFATGNSTLSSTGTVRRNSFIVSGAGVVSVGVSNGSLIVSVPSGGGAGDGGNTIAAGTRTATTSGALLFSDLNGISWGLNAANGSVMTASYSRNVVSNAIQAVGSATGSGTNTSRFAADDHVHAGVFSMGVSNLGNTVGDTRVDVGRFVLQGGNNVTLSQITAANALNTIIVSAGAGGGGETRVSAYAVGNTTQSSSGTIPLSLLSVQGQGIVSAGVSNGSIVVSATQSNQAFSAAGGASNFQTLGFSDNAYASWTNTNGSVALTELRASLFAVSNTTQSSSGTQNIDAISFAGAGIASVGITNGSVVISVPSGGGGGDGGNILAAGTRTAGTNSSVLFSNAGGVTWGLDAVAGSVMTVSQQNSFSGFAPWNAGDMTVQTLGNASLYLQRFDLQNYLVMDRVIGLMRFSLSSSSNSSHGGTLSFFNGIYTLNGTTLSLLASGSGVFNWTNSSNNSSAQLSGQRLISASFPATTLPPGQYWLGNFTRTSTVNANWFTVSRWGFNTANSAISGFLGQASATSQNSMLGEGLFTASTSAIPGSIALSQISAYQSRGFALFADMRYSTV